MTILERKKPKYTVLILTIRAAIIPVPSKMPNGIHFVNGWYACSNIIRLATADKSPNWKPAKKKPT